MASSENTRDHHQCVLIMNSDELKSKVNELSSLLEDSEMDGEKERESLQVGECVTKSVEILFQLRKQVSHIHAIIWPVADLGGVRGVQMHPPFCPAL